MSGTVLTILGFAVIFAATTLGASLVFLFKKGISEKLSCILTGFAAGIMIAASVWSLIIPSIEQSLSYGAFAFLPAALGILLGGLFMVFIDKCAPAINIDGVPHQAENRLKKPTRMFLAMTIHNVPEGLAVGFAFGYAALCGVYMAFLSAFGLAVGIAIQNFPEGAAVSLPINAAINDKKRAFMFGMGSGAVEPVAAVIGYGLSTALSVLQPWLLAVAAGAMLFVVIEDLIPDASNGGYQRAGTWGAIVGFVIMLSLDVALG